VKPHIIFNNPGVLNGACKSGESCWLNIAFTELSQRMRVFNVAVFYEQLGTVLCEHDWPEVAAHSITSKYGGLWANKNVQRMQITLFVPALSSPRGPSRVPVDPHNQHWHNCIEITQINFCGVLMCLKYSDTAKVLTTPWDPPSHRPHQASTAY
jgi:hypothetical protein